MIHLKSNTTEQIIKLTNREYDLTLDNSDEVLVLYNESTSQSSVLDITSKEKKNGFVSYLFTFDTNAGDKFSLKIFNNDLAKVVFRSKAMTI